MLRKSGRAAAFSSPFGWSFAESVSGITWAPELAALLSMVTVAIYGKALLSLLANRLVPLLMERCRCAGRRPAGRCGRRERRDHDEPKFVTSARNWRGPARAPVAALTVAAQVSVGP